MLQNLLIERLTQNEEAHVHDSYELIFVLYGTITCQERDTFWSLHAGDLLLINPCFVHAVMTNEQTILVRLWISISQLASTLPDAQRPPFFLCNPSLTDKASADSYKYLRGLISEAALTALIKPEYYQLKQERDLMDLLYCLCTQFLAADSDKFQFHTDPRLLDVFSYTQIHHADTLSLAEIAEMHHLTAPYFAKMFKKICGFTYHTYLTRTRLDYAVQDLLNSDLGITAISEKHGFPNLAAFYKAFQDTYHQSPKKFRKQHCASALFSEDIINPVLMPQVEDLLRHYTSDTTPSAQTLCSIETTSLSIDLTASAEPLPSSWTKLVNIGLASDALLGNVQDDLRSIQNDIHFEYIHFHGLFDDSMHVYTLGRDNKVSISFINIDRIIEFFYSIGLKPYVEFSFMPKALAQKAASDSVSISCCSPPKDISQWCLLIENFLHHYINQYGLSEVEQWLFQIWDSACFKDWWWGSFSEFCVFYRETYRTIRQISPHLHIGSPSVNAFLIQNGSWLEDFLEYCSKNDCMPDFLSIAAYPHGKDYCFTISTDGMLQMRPGSESCSDTQKFARTSTNSAFLTEFLKMLRKKVKPFGYTEEDIFITQWNSAHMAHTSEIMMTDTAFNAVYLVKNLCENGTFARSFGYWCISDAKEEYASPDPPFHGGVGTINNIGIKKAAYYAYMLLAKMQGMLISHGEGYYITRSKDGQRFYLLFYVYVHYHDRYCNDARVQYKAENAYEAFARGRSRKWEISLNGITPGEYRIKRYSVNRSHGSSFDKWLEMGAPQSLERDDTWYLQSISVPDRSIFYQYLDTNCALSFQLEPFEVCLYEIVLQKSRNAQD